MSGGPTRLALLGSQREEPDAGRVLDSLAVTGPVALVTAGWQEWEGDDAKVRRSLRREIRNLELYRRAETVWRRDPELASAHQALGDRVRVLRRAYNARLAPAMDAWMHLEAMAGDDEVLAPERQDALEAVRALDRHQLVRLAALREEFQERWRPLERDVVAGERREIEAILAGTAAVMVEGGHVPVLLNRLRLFGIAELLAGKSVVACSGGAMALGERVVLFHDSPPWGPGHSEVGESGLELYRGVVAFPLASRRLRLDDPGRVSRLARRFAPDACVLLEPGGRTTLAEGRWSAEGARCLSAAGAPETWRPAA